MYRINKLGLTLEIEDTLLSSIIDIGVQHYPNEFGGFLIGNYSKEQTHLCITDTILPNKYMGTPYLFERDTVGINDKLKQFYEQDPKKYYLGPDLYDELEEIKANPVPYGGIDFFKPLGGKGERFF